MSEHTDVEKMAQTLKLEIAALLRKMERVTEKDGSRWVNSDDLDTLTLRLETHRVWP